MMPPPSEMAGLNMAWVLLINADQPSEGVYTHTYPGDAPFLVAFESRDDAEAFARQMMASGFDPVTPFCWGADELTRFSHKSGLKLQVTPHGDLPPLPATFDRPGELGMGESQFWSHEKRPNPYTAYRLRLEALFPRRPENCGDDDCIPDEDTLPTNDGSRDHLRNQAMLAIDAILAVLHVQRTARCARHQAAHSP